MAARKDVLRRIRKIWAALGAGAIVIFVAWSAVAFRASPAAQEALSSDSRVVVKREGNHWRFTPKDGKPRNVALLFFPGAMVDPAAYAPLIRSVALAGYQAVLMELPRRGVMGGADGAEALGRAVMNQAPDVSAWIVAGHSRGAVVAATLAHQGGPGIAGLVLIGTTHPRDFTLADTRFPVTKIMGTKDGIAPVAASEANRRLLPKDARWVVIEGANHSQFGSYGFQPGDRFATIDRAAQQNETLKEIVVMLEATSRDR